MPRGALDWSMKPGSYKEYPVLKRVMLADPGAITGMPLTELLNARKSTRRFQQRPISMEQLSYLLWASDGLLKTERRAEFRTAPSAGALYPIETYLVVNNVVGLKKGVYHYSAKGHFLEELKLGDFGEEISRAGLDQRMCARSAVVFVWTAVFSRTKWKYKERGYRYIYLDMGHIGQNLALSATSLGLGSCQIGALYDDEANMVIEVDGDEESVIYMSVVGHPLLK